MSTDLEQRLARMLQHQAETVTTVPAYRSTDAAPRTVAPRTVPISRLPRRTWYGLAAAAAVILVVAVAVAVVTHHSRPTPAGNGVICSLARSASFTAAVQHGALPPGAAILALAPDGTELVARQQQGATQSVDLIGSDGRAHRIWTAGSGQRVRAIANPNGAMTDFLVTFVLRSLDSRSATVMIAPRDGHAVRLTEGDRGYDLAVNPAIAPVVIDTQVDVLESAPGHPSTQKLLVYSSGPYRWAKTPGQPYTAVTQLLPVGGNLVLARTPSPGNVDLQFLDPGYRPDGLEVAARAGYGFSTDRTTLTWFTDDGTGRSLWRWAPGQPTATRRTLPAGLAPTLATGDHVAAGPAAGGPTHLAVDLRTRTVRQLPSGMQLVGIQGGFAVVSYPASGGLGYSRIPVSALASCH